MTIRLPALLTIALALLTAGCDSATEVERATREGILIIGNAGEPKGLDPHIVSGVLESNIIRAIFEGLITEHPSEDGVACPGVAEKWIPNEDKSEWTFHLRKNAAWSDGHPLTAEDFLFSFKRILSKNLASDYSFMLYHIVDAEAYHKQQRAFLLCRNNPEIPDWEILKEVDFEPNEKLQEKEETKNSFNAKGLDALNKKQLEELKSDPSLFAWPDAVPEKIRNIILDKSLEFASDENGDLWEYVNFGASAPDPHTLVVKLKGPVPFLPELTKHYTWYPVPKHIVEKFGDYDEPFTGWTRPENIESNGPFVLKSWRINDHIEVERNPKYWDAETVSLNGIRYLPIVNSYTESRMFFNGQLHLTYKTAPEMIAYSKKRVPDNVRAEPYLGTYFIRCNVDSEAFNDPRVRTAFSLSLDQKSIIENVTLGDQYPASGLVPPFGDYPPSKDVTFDPEEARKLLAEAGYPNGEGLPDIEFLTTDRDDAKALAEALQAMWKENLGVTIKIKQMEWATYLNTMFEQEYDLAAGGWIGDYLDPLTFLDMWVKDGGNNRTGWSNEKFETILDQAGQTGDGPERYRLLKEAESLFLKERPILPIYWYTRNYLMSNDLKGWHPLILDNHPFKHLKLEPGS